MTMSDLVYSLGPTRVDFRQVAGKTVEIRKVCVTLTHTPPDPWRADPESTVASVVSCELPGPVMWILVLQAEFPRSLVGNAFPPGIVIALDGWAN